MAPSCGRTHRAAAVLPEPVPRSQPSHRPATCGKRGLGRGGAGSRGRDSEGLPGHPLPADTELAVPAPHGRCRDRRWLQPTSTPEPAGGLAPLGHGGSRCPLDHVPRRWQGQRGPHSAHSSGCSSHTASPCPGGCRAPTGAPRGLAAPRHPWDHCPGCPHTHGGSWARCRAGGAAGSGGRQTDTAAMEAGGNAPRPRRHQARGQRDTGTWRRGQAARDAPTPLPPPRLLSELGHGDKPLDGPRGAGTHGKATTMPRTRATTPSTRRHTGRGHGGAMGTPTRTHRMAPRKDRRGRGSWGGKIRLKQGKMKAEEPAMGPAERGGAGGAGNAGRGHG